MNQAIYDLEIFITAQQPIYQNVLVELAHGSKQGHWMWFIFPQLKGLGQSQIAKHYAIHDLAHAKAYLLHPILSPRLDECIRLVLAIENKTVAEILGSPDDLKFHSSMTLFHQASPSNRLIKQCLNKYFKGALDAKSLEILDDCSEW